jgi:hypothetical protein
MFLGHGYLLENEVSMEADAGFISVNRCGGKKAKRHSPSLAGRAL